MDHFRLHPTHFDEDYYLRGLETGKSNYHDFRWLPDTTLPLADHLKFILGIRDGDTLMDVGCARGFLVKALRMRGVNAFGCDISQWAIENCDPAVKEFVTLKLPYDDPPPQWDFITLKDVCEHIKEAELYAMLGALIRGTRKKLLMIVPLTHHVGGSFLRDEDNADPSHVIMWPLAKWMEFVEAVVGDTSGYVTGSWHYPGLKPASSQVPHSCGFIQFTRVSP